MLFYNIIFSPEHTYRGPGNDISLGPPQFLRRPYLPEKFDDTLNGLLSKIILFLLKTSTKLVQFAKLTYFKNNMLFKYLPRGVSEYISTL
jgi:hypothetical protein